MLDVVFGKNDILYATICYVQARTTNKSRQQTEASANGLEGGGRSTAHGTYSDMLVKLAVFVVVTHGFNWASIDSHYLEIAKMSSRIVVLTLSRVMYFLQPPLL